MTSTITSAAGSFDPARLLADESDETEIKRFYDHYQPLLTRYARRKGSPDPEGIADLAFFDGLRAASTLRSPTETAFRAYLFRAAQNRVISEARRSAVELTDLVVDDLMVGCGPAVDAVVVDTIVVDGLLDVLTVDQRKVIRHRFYDGYTAAETAARMDKTPGAVRKMQHDAVVRLRRAVAVIGLVALAVLAWLAFGTLGESRAGHRLIVEPAVDGVEGFDRGDGGDGVDGVDAPDGGEAGDGFDGPPPEVPPGIEGVTTTGPPGGARPVVSVVVDQPGSSPARSEVPPSITSAAVTPASTGDSFTSQPVRPAPVAVTPASTVPASTTANTVVASTARPATRSAGDGQCNDSDDRGDHDDHDDHDGCDDHDD